MQSTDTSYRWHHWSVVAEKGELFALLAALDASLPTAWRKLSGEDAPVPTPMAPDVVAGYRLNPTPRRSGVTLTLDLIRDSELHGGRMFGEFPASATERAVTTFAGAEVDRFLDEGLLPAAAKVGVKVQKGTVSDLFLEELPYDVREALVAFGGTTRKTLPLDWAEGEAWQAFVVAAYRSTAVFDRDQMREWFVTNGWSDPAVTELITQFFDQCRLLARYHDALVIA